ncbi:MULTISPECIES: InlB B-repeat-containing protein [Parabacteroides]|uniref:InlB B-repeat-containing protein n=1 Tax=Parabacteroides provencensis TaxID=1944636 RepID=UPI000C14FA2E|nr:InlB B-repeat-containing protein [Parabacteroides provencensis]
MEKILKLKSNLCSLTVLAFMLLTVTSIQAVNISSAQELKNALGNASVNGNVVTLTGNIERREEINIVSGDIILDLGGNNYICNGYDKGLFGIITYLDINIFRISGGSLTIEGNGGTLYNRNTDNSTIVVDGGILKVNSGYIYSNDPNSTTSRTANAITVNNGSCIINGGKIEAKKERYGAIGIQINGGTFLMRSGEISATAIKNISNLQDAIGLKVSGGDVKIIGGGIKGENTNDNASYGYAIRSNLSVSNLAKGCVVKKDGVGQDASGNDMKGSITISPINYTIKYDSNNGKITSDSYTTSYSILNDGEARTLPIATREHYKLLHWYNNSGDNINENTALAPSTFPYIDIDHKDDQTVSFKAKWEALPYTITYNTDGGGTIASTPYTVENYPESLPTPTRDGYMFTGWFNGATPVTSPTALAGNVTLTARWSEYKYALSYVTNTETTPSAQNYTKATSGTIKIPSTWERKGYTFKGWYDNEKFDGSPVTVAPCPQDGKNVIVSLKLYAKWEAIPYTLNYDLNGGGTFAITPDATYTIEKTPYVLPVPKPKTENITFKGWYNNPGLTGDPITTIAKGDISNKHYYAKWVTTYYAICHWESETRPGIDKVEDKKISFTKEDEIKLPVWDIVDGYDVVGWYEQGQEAIITTIKKGTERDLNLYAKWKLAEYSINYEAYYGTLSGDAAKTYTVISEDITLPYPVRSGFTFAGWYTEQSLVNRIEKLPKGSMGDKTYYAKWLAGNIVVFDKPANGKISVKNGTTEIKSGEKVGANTKLTVMAIPESSVYSLVKLTVNGKEYTSSPQEVEVPADKGLTVSAEFADLRPSALAPKITTTPSNTDFVPAGESVTVSLTNTDDAATLYYSIDGSTPKQYTQPFQVSSLAEGKTVVVTAYAKKNGHKDGVATRNVAFGKGKVTIMFTLPKGVTAINPEGGEVISAVASGGSFEFKLLVEKAYFESVDDLKVEANGVVIHPNAKNIYTLPNQTGNITVRVSGINGITHTVTLKQSANGYICYTGENEDSAPRTVSHGDRVSVTATADTDYKFFSWTDGTSDNPRQVLVEKDTVIQARFVQEDPGYLMVLPTLTGAKVKPLTGYATEVKKGGTFKFYISKESDYSESVPEVYANGEKLTVYKDVYSIYNVKENVVIAVDGIQLNKTVLKLAENVLAFNLETAEQITDQALTPTTLIYLLAKSPAGKRFSMWNDGKADNPRIIAVKDAQQLLPLFISTSSEKTVKVDLPLIPGAGMGAVNANAEAIASGSDVQLKLVILPQYSKSQPIVTVEGKVLEPGMLMRSSSETKTLFYNLDKLAKDVKVEVSGLELNGYTVSLQQNTGGTIRASKTGLLKHGTVITLNATPSNGNIFLKWGDGNTMNPYTYTVTGDCAFSAQFGNGNIPLNNESIGMDGVRIYVSGRVLHVEAEKAMSLCIWNFGGQMTHNIGIPAGNSAVNLRSGEYVVKVGENKPVKISIR